MFIFHTFRFLPHRVLLFFALSAVASQFIPVDECPLVADCCEEDCCGPSTSWYGSSCDHNTYSYGFTGEYSERYIHGCVERKCCGSGCCGQGTVYVSSAAFCLSTLEIQKVGYPCLKNEQCETGYCYLPGDTTEPRRVCASCNPESNEPCRDHQTCDSTLGRCKALESLLKLCEKDCLSGYCFDNGKRLECAGCNPSMQFGCDPETETCISKCEINFSACEPACYLRAGESCFPHWPYDGSETCASHNCNPKPYSKKCLECAPCIQPTLYVAAQSKHWGCEPHENCVLTNDMETLEMSHGYQRMAQITMA